MSVKLILQMEGVELVQYDTYACSNSLVVVLSMILLFETPNIYRTPKKWIQASKVVKSSQQNRKI